MKKLYFYIFIHRMKYCWICIGINLWIRLLLLQLTVHFTMLLEPMSIFVKTSGNNFLGYPFVMIILYWNNKTNITKSSKTCWILERICFKSNQANIVKNHSATDVEPDQWLLNCHVFCNYVCFKSKCVHKYISYTWSMLCLKLRVKTVEACEPILRYTIFKL